MTPHIVIAGGGITGLAAAYALATDRRASDLGVHCTLIEQDTRLGGKLLTEHRDGCLIEHGPDSFLSTKPWAAELCRQVGLGDRLVATLPGRAVFVAYRGRLHPLPEGMAFGVPTRFAPLIRTGLLSPAEKLRVAVDLVLPRDTRTADETIGGMIRRRLGGAVAERLAGPLLGGIYAGDPDFLSVRATFPLLREWEATHRSLILAALSRSRKMRRDAGAHGPSPMFLSLAGGVGELVERLLQRLNGTTVLAGRTVTSIGRRQEMGRTRYAVTLEDGHVLPADALLLATPAYVTAGLMEKLAPAAASGLRSIPYVSTAAVTLAYRRADIGAPLDGHGFVVARSEPLNITACTWLSSKWPRRAPPDRALLRCYLGASGREAVVEEDEERLVHLARADLRATMGLDAVPTFTAVARWMKAMPQYPAGHLDRMERIEADLQRLPGIALAGAGYRGIGIPDCIRQATAAADRLVEHLSALAAPNGRPATVSHVAPR